MTLGLPPKLLQSCFLPGYHCGSDANLSLNCLIASLVGCPPPIFTTSVAFSVSVKLRDFLSDTVVRANTRACDQGERVPCLPDVHHSRPPAMLAPNTAAKLTPTHNGLNQTTIVHTHPHPSCRPCDLLWHMHDKATNNHESVTGCPLS